MKPIWGAYLEDYSTIKLIIPASHNFKKDAIYLRGAGKKYRLIPFKEETYGEELHLYTHFQGVIYLHIDYQVFLSPTFFYPLSLGKITRTPRFEFETAYNGPLGCEYHKEYTVFRIWAPVAKEAVLVLVHGETTQQHMKYVGKGVWEFKVTGDLDKWGYYFLIRVNKELEPVLDPYGISASPNFTMNYVIDWEKTYAFQNKRPPFSGSYVDAIIYELHLRDFSINRFLNNPSERRSYYFDMITTSSRYPDSGLKHLKRLGITHVQLLPIFGFGGVNETNQETGYNWGYNPVSYNTPSNWYAYDLNNPYGAINELKQMIDGLHFNGIKVNMDVVYNHVFDSENFSYAKFVPGYFYRYDAKGFKTNASGCGNDLATERYMVRRFVIDSLMFWTTHYLIDGFRLDLMGLMDTTTILEMDKKLTQIYPEIMLYGEGWDMPTTLEPHKAANYHNYWQLKNIAFFNDLFRDGLKGSPLKITKGYALGEKIEKELFIHLIKGSCQDEFRFLAPNQSLNFVECHDNYTFYDQMKILCKNFSPKEQIDYVRLSLGLVVFSQGIPFIHAGEEFLRTKQGVENSYKSSDEINALDWSRQKEYDELTESLSDMIALRKEYSLFRMSERERVEKRIKFDKRGANQCLSFRLIDETEELQVIISNTYEPEVFYFAPLVTMIFDGKRKVQKEVSQLEINKPGIFILKRR